MVLRVLVPQIDRRFLGERSLVLASKAQSKTPTVEAPVVTLPLRNSIFGISSLRYLGRTCQFFRFTYSESSVFQEINHDHAMCTHRSQAIRGQ